MRLQPELDNKARGEDLLVRYQTNVGWNINELLDVLVLLLKQRGDFHEITARLDGIAERQMELEASIGWEATTPEGGLNDGT